MIKHLQNQNPFVKYLGKVGNFKFGVDILENYYSILQRRGELSVDM